MKSENVRLGPCLTWILVFLAASFPLAAQSHSSSAELFGTIQAPDGARLPRATVTVTHLKTGLERVVLSSESGEFRLQLLPPGSYAVRVEAPGFAAGSVPDAVLTVGQYAELNFTLQLAGATFSVLVEAKPRIVESEKTVQASTISEREIDDLPINGRNFLDFVLLTPALTVENSLDTTTPTANPTSGFVVTGQNPRSNYVTIDGVDNMDVAQLSVRPALSQEAVQEFQVNRSSFSAEFGRARGGVVNIVSRSGGKEFRGSAFFLARNQALDARNTFATQSDVAPQDPPFKRYQFGGAMGGSIHSDRTFFFASYEGLRRDESVFVTFLDDPGVFQATPSQTDLFGFLGASGIPDLAAIAGLFADPNQGLLNTTPLNFPGTIRRLESESGTFPFAGDNDSFSFRLDHEFSENNRFFGRFNLGNLVSQNANFGGLKGVSNGVGFDLTSYALVLGDTHFVSPTTSNDFRFQHFSHDVAVEVNQARGPEIVIAGLAQIGRDFTNPTGYDLDSFQFVDHLSLSRGRHNLKAGIDLNLIDAAGFADVFKAGQFVFAEALPLAILVDTILGPGTTQELGRLLASPPADGGLGRPDLIPNLTDPLTALQAFNFGLPLTYFQGFGDTTSRFDFNQLALFLQDQWRIRDNFTLNLGLRYDTEWQGSRLTVTNAGPPFSFDRRSPRDRNNLAPRLGFAWDPWNNGRTVVRGGYGLFFGPLNQSLTFTSTVLGGGLRQFFLPITGIPGVPATSVDIWQLLQTTGELTEESLASIGVVAGTTPGVIFPSDPQLQNPYSHQASLGIEHELARDWSIDLAYLLNRGLHLVRIRDLNVREIAPDTFALPGLDPRFLQVNLIESTGSSIYHGMTLGLQKRFDRNYSFRMAYTLGKAIDDISDFTVPMEAHNHNNLSWQRGLSTFDQRHRLVASGLYQSPLQSVRGNGFWKNLAADWKVSPILTWSSGRPFSLFLGNDGNGDGQADSDRPRLADGSLVGRNTGRGPSFFSTDLRVARQVRLGSENTRLELILEAFNLWNNVNYSEVNQVVGTQSLSNGDVSGSSSIPSNRPLGFTAAFNPRQFQLGLRFRF